MGKLAQHLHLGVRGEIDVELEKTTLLPGDRLVGAVRLTVSKSIPSASFTVRAVGTQSLNWLTSSGESTVSHSRTHEHWFEEILLEQPDTSFEPGQRAYALAFTLPVDLQHNFSFTCRRIEELQAVRIGVKYAVVATLVAKGIATANIVQQAVFTVNPLPMAVPLGNPVTASESRDVKMFSMLKRGSCGVSMEIENDVFDCSSVIETLVSLRLDTTRTLKYVLLVLYEEAYVDRHHGMFPGLKRGCRVVCCRRFDKATFADLQTNSNSSSNSNSNSNSKSSALILRLPITPNDISEFEPLNPTMSSHYVSLSYRVGVECKLSMAPRIKVSVPVTIVRKLVATEAP